MATITTINNGDTGAVARAAINNSLTNLNSQANTNTSNVSALTTRVTTAEGEIDTLQTDVTTLQARELKRLASKTVSEINGELRDGFYTVASTLTAVNSGNFILVSDSGTVSNANCSYLNGKTLAAGDWVISVNVGGSQIWYLVSNEVSGGGGISDGDKGDITVSSSGAIWTIDSQAVTFGKIQNISQDHLIGRNSAGAGSPEALSATQVRALLNVEDGADVTDTANVTAAGALMDSEVVNLDQVKAFDSADYATAAQGALADTALQSSSTVTDFIGGVIEAPADQDYKLVVNLPYGATITETTTISTAGTCTATFKIGTTALGGTANSVSTTENSQTHSSANVASAGDDIVVTISANSGCEFLSFTIKFTRTLS